MANRDSSADGVPLSAVSLPSKIGTSISPEPTINSSMDEHRVFPASVAFSKSAHVKSRSEYDAIYKKSIEAPEAFWSEQARTRLDWSKPFDSVLEWVPPFAKWFQGGQLNAAYNCLDRHLVL